MISELNTQNGVPLYKQLIDVIRNAISCGEYAQDAKIPTEVELSQMYNVSRITVRNAIEELVEDGLLIKRRGKGTFVAPNPLQRDMKMFMGFTQSCEVMKRSSSSKVLELSLQPISKKQADFMQKAETENILRLRRLRCMDEQPVMIETSFLPTDYNFLLQERLEGSLYEALHKNGIYPAHGRRIVSICYATKEESELLKVPQDSALLLMNDYVSDQNYHPIHVAKQVIRSELYKLVIDT